MGSYVQNVATPASEYLELLLELDELEDEFDALERKLQRAKSVKAREKINKELDKYNQEMIFAQDELAALKQQCYDEGYDVPMRPGADAPYQELMAEYAAEESASLEESEIESDHEQRTDGGGQD